jgi:dihydrofolate reductase
LPTVADGDIRFVEGDVGPVHDEMVAAADGRNVWLVGGGELVGVFADRGLLDEILLGVQPVFLGSGAPLLPRRLTSKRIRLESAGQDGQQVQLVYSVGAP